MANRHYIVAIKYDDPYPKTWESRPIEARTVGRAIDFATRDFKKSRPRKREPVVINVRAERL